MNKRDEFDEQAQFKKLLAHYPRIAKLWDFEKKEVDITRYNKELKVMSTGEQVLASFFISVWLGKQDKVFDITEINSLDKKERELIANWILNPFYP